MRYNEVLDYKIQIAPELEDIETLKLLVQPLVENALYHGIKPKGSKGVITVSAYQSDQRILIEVTDNGVGIPVEKLKSLRKNLKGTIESNHYGIYNINERLKYKYGSEAGLILDSIENFGTKITLYFPTP